MAWSEEESEDDNFDRPIINPYEDKITVYECGHPFHTKCIERHIANNLKERSQGPSNRNSVEFRQIPKDIEVNVTPEMVEKQFCPHCYSEAFKIDFEAIFKSRNRIGASKAPRFKNR